MTTARQLRRAAASLPEAVAREDRNTFEIGRKPFAAVTDDAAAHLWLPPDAVRQVEGEYPTAERRTRGAAVTGVLIPLADINGQQLNRWVRQAWKHRAPKRLVDAAEAAERAEPGDGDLPHTIGRPATRALAEAGITTLDGIAQLSESELASLHGVGPKAVRILREALDR